MRVRPLFVAVLVILTGCSGVLDGGSDNPDIRITPAPIPTDRPTPTPVPQLAPGLTGEGIGNGRALVAASESFYRNRSFTAITNVTVVAPNGSVLRQSTGTVQARPAGEGYQSSSERTGGSYLANTSTYWTGSEVWWDGERYFLKSAYSNGTTTYRRLPIDGMTGYRYVIGTIPGIINSLGTNETVVTERIFRNGTMLYRVRGTARSEIQGNVSFQFLVDSRGIIREYKTVQQVSFIENNSQIIIETQFSRIGTTNVSKRPSWVDEALNQTTPIPGERRRYDETVGTDTNGTASETTSE